MAVQRDSPTHSMPNPNWKRKPKKLLKWNIMSAYEKETILDAFWSDYFAKYPKPGGNDELNTMRKQFQSRRA